MEITISDIISVVGLLLGGSGIGYLFTWQYQRRRQAAQTEQAEAEATQAEANAAKELQDVYQQLISDIKTDRDEQKAYIQELKGDRQQLREDRDSLRRRQDELEEKVRTLEASVARNDRKIEGMRPFLCGRPNCPDRVLVTVSDSGEVSPRQKKKQEIEPYNGD